MRPRCGCVLFWVSSSFPPPFFLGVSGPVVWNLKNAILTQHSLGRVPSLLLSRFHAVPMRLTPHNCRFSVVFYARSSPPGMRVTLSLGSWATVPLQPTGPLGLTSYSQYQPVEETAFIASSNWTEFTVAVPAKVRPTSTSFQLRVGFDAGSTVFPAGAVWIDDVSIRNVSGY